MNLFNQALLAKNGWKMLCNPKSVCAQTIKTKYFPHTDFLQATKGKKPSYIWSSLLWGKDLLKNGVGWKLGSREVVKVWFDNWIPTDTYFKLFVSNQHTFPNLRVFDLIDHQFRT